MKKSSKFSMGLVIIGLLTLGACAESDPMPFPGLEGRWSPMGRSCDDSNVYFDFHKGIAQAVARHEPASQFLFRYKEVSYIDDAQKDEQGKAISGTLSFLASKIDLASPALQQGYQDNPQDWQAWQFGWKMDGVLKITHQHGAPISNATNPDELRHYTLIHCPIKAAQ